MTTQITAVADLQAWKAASDCKYTLFFWAAWHEPSKVGGQMQGVFSALAEKYTNIRFGLVEAEAVPDLSETFEVTVVPTFFTCVGDKIVSKLEGANPATLSKLVKELHDLVDASHIESEADKKKAAEKQALIARLGVLTRTAPVMLFMKGSPAQPKCGFSRQIVEILNAHDIQYASFDILTDDAVRQGLKELSDWPTYPQLYVNGQLVGGLDIVKELVQAGDLKGQLGIVNPPLPPAPEALNNRLVTLINKAPAMLFMKGCADSPRCGFSSQIVHLLKDAGVEFSSFDILSDEEVRQGLKTYSDWPTYPQLYVKGQLVGGLDIVKEMAEGGDLRGQLGL